MTYDGTALLEAIRAKTGKRIQGRGPQYKTNCPAHDDSDASLSILIRPDRAKLHCWPGCDRDSILAAVDLDWRALYPPPSAGVGGRGPWMPCMTDFEQDPPARVPGHEVAVEYPYHDPRIGGALVRGVSRCVQKCFRQWRPDPSKSSGKAWTTKLPDGTEVGHDLVYRAGELLEAIKAQRTVYIVEGEKDANRLWSLDYPATCNPQGSDGWHADHAIWFHGADVVVIADKDVPGWRHAVTIVGTLADVAASIEVVQAVEGKDASDHLDAGLRMWQLDRVAEPKAPSLLVPGCDQCKEAA